ncbi:hypothetical protein W97_09036 [Coniosporium apollinis CBS 100218]|uniref:Kinesin-like protein n=1 Tax=Coniosporium apollinis (strain CBS 100218) TaxID=1168221 RepID=R7Z6P1_CONA1|nr:uncharacterized protein W97_09036 [Coniosporium apollinis CBS 100218]EON69773.1 hypothetical protein W97_09036 [Coniosporium apollinis CBS 100218]
MHTFRRLKSRKLLTDAFELLDDIMDPRLYRGISSESISPYYESTASTPSLRAPERAATPDTMADQEGGNVKVVVRVRRHVKREIERGAECLIRMDPHTQRTTLLVPNDTDPANARSNSRKIYEEKSFTFDKSFWSHDPTSSHYADQSAIYRSFGEEFLDHNFAGYHTCIFAYGQTGSGKSYTMMGTPEAPGLIPRTCQELFHRIESDPTPNTTYNVHVSYLEIYNEHVRDLLASRPSSSGGQPKDPAAYYLKIRESPADGVYIQGLTDVAVRSYADISRLFRIGDANRTTAATKMNDSSSRSHAVFTIHLKQIQHSMTTDSVIERSARMRLVDLAGSERAKATEATGQRLVEGGKINKSLTTLGRVIAALADPKRCAAFASGKPSKRSVAGETVVPYRDSVLTWLLKDSLGGNSKTAMVACIAPSDYDETLSTLRYASQAKMIRTRATVNQDAVSAAQRDAQIAEMAATIAALQTSFHAATVARKREEATELEEYQKQVGRMQRMMEESRLVSEAKIRSLTAEVEELRPLCERLRGEGEALRRHLGLVVGELRNPIVLPTPRDSEPVTPEGGEEHGGNEEDKENAGDEVMMMEDEGYEDEGEEFARELHAHAEDFLKEIGMFRKKVGGDYARFGERRVNPLAEVTVN